ncbi:gamma-interferon-inducible lysosomal thiol reductase-like [Diachasmimorpha longicaudata]|uniref:gamma-interferon-inducible lysosomal thiol reductase-like n=1 Tax=Diachasmimorpha longicaudata TaxID=58733 RepID=UPI0030B91769
MGISWDSTEKDYSRGTMGLRNFGGVRWWFRFTLIALAVVFLWIFVRNDRIDEVGDFKKLSVMPVPRIKHEKVKITVYYEALCPDSRSFVVRQVVPTYQKIPDNVVVQMVPYGKATTIPGPNGYTFNCQHGPRECEANTIHACAIDVIKDPDVQLKFLACMIERNIWPQNITRTCADRFHVDAEPIFKCYKSPRGAELLAKYGEMTHALPPPLKFIPTITLDNDIGNQIEILKDLLRAVCKRFKHVPDGCH